jgi:hypothetical protein
MWPILSKNTTDWFCAASLTAVGQIHATKLSRVAYATLHSSCVIRRGAFHSADELEQAIYQWLAHWNEAHRLFKASADVILDKVRRCKELSKTGY